jgi:hypothetical protein
MHPVTVETSSSGADKRPNYTFMTITNIGYIVNRVCFKYVKDIWTIVCLN